MVRLLRVVITALWLCVAVGLVFAAEWVNAFGPAYLTDHWTIVVLRLGLWAGALSALGHRVFHHPTWINILSALVMVFASIAVMLGVQAVVFSERGSTTVCTVLGVDERKVREYRGDGHWTTTTYYDHYLDCADPTVQTVTALHSPSAEVGEVLTVVYDSQRRAPAQFAREVGEPRTWFELCAICAGLAFMLRAAAEVVTREQDDTATAVVGALVFDLAVLLNGLLFLALLVAALRSAGWFTATVLDLFGVGGASYGWALSILTAAVLVALAAYLSLVRGHRLLGRLLAAIPSLSWDDRVSRELLVESFDSWMIRAAEHTVKRWFSRSYAKSAS